MVHHLANLENGPLRAASANDLKLLDLVLILENLSAAFSGDCSSVTMAASRGALPRDPKVTFPGLPLVARPVSF